MSKYQHFKENGITFGMISVVLISMIIVLILALVKIYLSNQIYYESKKVNAITREVAVLNAENIMLKRSVESAKYKNRVEDTLFTLEDN